MILLAHQEHPEISLVQLCDLLDVSRSWYYESGEKIDPVPQDIALRDEIERIILEYAGYGYRRVTHELSRRGWMVNHKRVLRIMQEESLLWKTQKTLCDHHHQFASRLCGVSQCAGRCHPVGS